MLEKSKKNPDHPKDDLTTSQMLSKIKEMQRSHDELMKKIEESLQKVGWSKEYIESYFSNPSNFGVKEWERYQQRQKAFMDSLKLPKRNKDVGAKDSGKSSKERRKLRSRRNWLPMR